ncbi:anaerobic glycerol-3-phosphate dehydrogenase subunit C [Moorella sulfitireducens (nom. illeg.)]|uniref:anaerobic glycerol-3-phosphate dehydrogenase subunit C n=1 Tax=Neomoorella sulfitireducens TaxID=2972948 RepID=UPI0021AC068B|nr:anaerobic glycerol-3-phosphate dehydrogenase subunit C [Moorella sulfitireducens]
MNVAAIHAQEFEACQKCTLCESFCPVLQVEPSFPGPKMAGANGARLVHLQEKGPAAVGTLDLCTDCRTCNLVCPSGIKPATLILKQRWQGRSSRVSIIRNSVLSRPDRIGKIISLWPSVVNWTLKQKMTRRVAERVIGIAAARSFPAYAPVTFRRWYARHASALQKQVAVTRKVVFFHGCYANFNRPDLGRHLVQVLENVGYEVIVPKQKCCGLPLSLNGDIEAARNLARDNLECILPYVEKGMPIVFTCPSCASMFKSYYVDVFDLPGAVEVAKNCFDACEFILNQIPEHIKQNAFGPVAMKIAYHTPCHLRAQGIGTPAVELLFLIPAIKLHVLGNNCCGMAGTYGFKAEKYDLSLKIGTSLFQEIKECQPDKVVTDCGTCALQIGENTGYTVIHPIDLLFQALEASRAMVKQVEAAR